MKKLLLMAFAAFMTVGASAQLISSNTVTHKEGRNYNRLSVSYNAVSMDDDFIDGSMSGFSLAWTKGISLSSSTPLYIETGLGLTYAFKSDDYSDEGYSVDVKNKYLYLAVPVNLVYKWNIPNTNMSLAPFAGIYFKGNLYGNTKAEANGYEDEMDWYDSDEGDGKRFNFGWNIGVGFEYSKLYVGLSYGSDLNEMFEDADKVGAFSVSLGFKF